MSTSYQQVTGLSESLNGLCRYVVYLDWISPKRYQSRCLSRRMLPVAYRIFTVLPQRQILRRF